MDVFTKKKRSEVMSKIRGQGNKSTEQFFEALLNEHGMKGWEKHYDIEGKPDFAFPELKIAVFVDGAFWHGHPESERPKTNTAFWKQKIERNKARDRNVNKLLRKKGWSVLRIWDTELKSNPKKSIMRLKRLVTLRTNKLSDQS